MTKEGDEESVRAPTKAVVFDLGGVLVEVDSEKALRELRRHRRAGSLTPSLAGLHSIVCAFESGELATQAFYEAVCGHEKLSVDLAQFCEVYCNIFSPAEEMIAVHAAVLRARLPTYIFSNTSELHFSYIRDRYPFTARFDCCFLSYQLGCMKPDPRAYAAVEEAIGCRGTAIAYIDDRAENVAAAVDRGWLAIHHTSAPLTAAALRKLGLL